MSDHTPSPGALRAAEAVGQEILVGAHVPPAFIDKMAEIIDRETAAPEVLEALRQAVAALECELTVEAQGCCPELDGARAAIAKAEKGK